MEPLSGVPEVTADGRKKENPDAHLSGGSWFKGK
jgi:hypothetical protein